MSSCCLPKSASTSVSASTWKARSQAAYHGYSHLSGIEMTSELCMWCQRSLRGTAGRGVGVERRGDDRRVEFVGLAPPLRDEGVERRLVGLGDRGVRQAQTDSPG